MNRRRTIMKKITHIMIISVLMVLFCIESSAGAFAPALAQLLRINTGAEISVVLAGDEKAVGERNIVNVRNVDGGVLYEKISELAAEGGDMYPYLSGVNAMFEVSDSAGVRKVKLTGMMVDNRKLDNKKTYTIALSQAADAYFEDCEKVASYSADNGLLYNYVEGFAPYDENEQQEEAASEQTPALEKQDIEEKNVIQKQGDILMLTIAILMVVLVIYLYMRKKKKQNDDGKNC